MIKVIVKIFFVQKINGIIKILEEEIKDYLLNMQNNILKKLVKELIKLILLQRI